MGSKTKSHPKRSMTKSPLALARLALAVGQGALPPYSSKFSRRDFIQAQHFAVLVLKEALKTDFRGIQQILIEWSDLRQVLKLESVPHWTTLEKAEKRLLKKGVSSDSFTASCDSHENVA